MTLGIQVQSNINKQCNAVNFDVIDKTSNIFIGKGGETHNSFNLNLSGGL